MKQTRRTFLGTSLGALAASRGLPALAQEGPIKIGCITTLSGAASILGKPQHLGMEIAAKKINESGGILGRKVQIIVRDDQSKPDVAVAAVRELSSDGVKIFAGVLASPVALAISGIAEELGIVFLNAASHGNNLTHENFRKNYFRVTDYSAMRISAASRLMAEKYPDVTKWGAIIPDAEIGRSTLATFQFAMPKYYGELNKKQVTIDEPSSRVPAVCTTAVTGWAAGTAANSRS
ncbi:ABC transporter substrate-binding protein, partial [Streptomyces albidoflavus]|uniref:ABC transporter substrate-binding protein n=1 Tax=Streptomyces albidoflavus TaxID=1886 RepID=UPI00342BF772